MKFVVVAGLVVGLSLLPGIALAAHASDPDRRCVRQLREARVCPDDTLQIRAGEARPRWSKPISDDVRGGGQRGSRPLYPRCQEGHLPGSPEDRTRAGQLRTRCHPEQEIHSTAPVPDREPGDLDAAPDLAAMVDEAFATITPGIPEVVTSPPVDPGAVTGLPLYLAVDGDGLESATATVSAGSWSVTGMIELVGLHVDPGDGSPSLWCAGLGTRWQPGDRPGPDDCIHTYTVVPEAGTVEVAVQLSYRAEATITRPDGTTTVEELGVLTGPTTTVTLPVREHRAVRTG